MAQSTTILTPSFRSVAGALAEVEEITVVALASSAGVGKSTVAKALLLLEQRGAARRTVREAGGIREADLWSPTSQLGALLFTDSGKASQYGHAHSLSDRSEVTAPRGQGSAPSARTANLRAAAAEPRGATLEQGVLREASPRLAPGELGALVLAVLVDHPNIDYTPTMLSHLLMGRSAGAIHNALEKMATAGTVRRTCDRPKRYRLADRSTSAKA